MHRDPIRYVLAGALTSTIAVAQCVDDQYPVTLVDQSGSPASATRDGPDGSLPMFRSSAVYLAVPGDLPAGDYLVTLRDSTGQQQLALIPASERRYRVRYDAGLQLVEALGTDPALPPLGAGLGGSGFGIPLFPFAPPDTSVGGPAGMPLPCVLQVMLGNRIDLAGDSVLPPRVDPFSGRCIGVRSLATFAVGDGTGATIAGTAFDDLDADGLHDAGEPGAVGLSVTLTDPDGAQTMTTTDGEGRYAFSGLSGGVYDVSITFGGCCTTATTPTSQEVTLLGCGGADAEPFGRSPQVRSCDARTARFWRSREGLRMLLRDRELLRGLRALPLVSRHGWHFNPHFALSVAFWSHDHRSRNMAYQLSVQLAAAYLNVAAGFVDADCMVRDERLGAMTVAELIRYATIALARDGRTRHCGDRNWAVQAALHAALTRMNENRAWL